MPQRTARLALAATSLAFTQADRAHLSAHEHPLEAPEPLGQGEQHDRGVVVPQVGAELVDPHQAQGRVAGAQVPVEGGRVRDGLWQGRPVYQRPRLVSCGAEQES